MPSIDEISQISMMNALKQLDVVSNNLANANTPGFKSDSVHFQPFDNLLTEQIKSGMPTVGNVPSAQVAPNLSAGAMKQTGNPLDFAIQGDAFFELKTGEQAFYSRTGSFTVAADGRLVNNNGLSVSGVDGDIYLQGGDISVNRDGTVFENGEEIGALKLTSFSSLEHLQKVGNGLWSSQSAPQTLIEQASIFQGYLEASNVEPVKEMTNMMMIMRQFESQSRALKEYDGMMNSAISTIADF